MAVERLVEGLALHVDQEFEGHVDGEHEHLESDVHPARKKSEGDSKFKKGLRLVGNGVGQDKHQNSDQQENQVPDSREKPHNDFRQEIEYLESFESREKRRKRLTLYFLVEISLFFFSLKIEATPCWISNWKTVGETLTEFKTHPPFLVFLPGRSRPVTQKTISGMPDTRKEAPSLHKLEVRLLELN